MLLPKQIEYLILENIDSGNEPLTDAKLILDEQKNALEKWREAKTNLITYSLNFGEIRPGARRSGFVFFPRLLSKNNRCRILFRDKTIDFIRSDVKKKEEK